MTTEFDVEWNYRHDIWNVVWLPIVFMVNIYFLLHRPKRKMRQTHPKFR